MTCARTTAALLACWLMAAAAVAPARAADAPPKAEAVEFFEKHIRPVLVEKCYRCHSAEAATNKKLKADLLLDTREGTLKGGENGAVLVPGDPEKSRLIEALRGLDPDFQMPPKEPLSGEQVAAFEAWVKMGAPDPRTGKAGAAPPAAYDWAEARKFWSFQPVMDPPAPDVRDKAWALSPIDRFIQARHESLGLKPVAAADRRALIRRATYDLTGLPPTPEEVEAFVSDDSPSAFEKVVDRLLASPHYGERWGRHWLDLVRYADTSGCNSDFPVPQAYRYRNWVIDAFNQDKPYDQFLREQLAGDLLPAKDEEDKRRQTIATGYLAISRRFGSRASEVHLTMEDIIENVGKSMLGLSVNCARCHDHKFDPIPDEDYYALYGIFNSTRYAFPGTEIYGHPKDLIPLGPPEEAEKLVAHEAKLAALDNHIEQLTREMRDALKPGEKDERTEEERAAAAKGEKEGEGDEEPAKKPEPMPADAPPVAEQRRPTPKGAKKRTVAEVKADLYEAQRKLRRLESDAPEVEKAYAVAEGLPHNVKLHRKGDPKSLGEEIPRGFLTVLGGQKLSPNHPGSGRLELAQWITDRSNPLTARVMANRIWQHHFGRGIVATPNDFGARGRPPTHPELLDYLASRFVESGWSVKAMHRAIMLSRTYQLSSAADSRNGSLDPMNESLWRFDPRRLSAEEIRDSILSISGGLDRKPGGPHPFPPETEWKYTQHKPFVADYPTNKRSVYLMQQRIRKQPFLAVFDGADTNAPTADRPLSTTAIQALFLMNDPFLHEQADKFAVRVGLAFPENARRIDYAHRLAFGRGATEEEISTGQAYLREVAESLKDAGLAWDEVNGAALASYVRVVMSSNEFVFLD